VPSVIVIAEPLITIDDVVNVRFAVT